MSKINYREDQLPIIQYENGKMAVPAVPGAGKTFIVTNLVAKLLEEKRQGKGKILILTYMNSAVNNFKINGGEKAFRFFLKEQKDPIWADRQLDAWEKGFYDLVQNTISELKYKDISPQKLEEYMRENRRGILKIILPIYKEYERRLKANGL